MHPSIRVRALAALGLVLVLAGVAGCGGRQFAPYRATDPAIVAGEPQADSPTNAVRRMEWAWSNRDYSAYARMLSNDFRSSFQFYSADDGVVAWFAGWSITQELIASGRMINSSSASLTLKLGEGLVDLPDPRPGKDPRYHRMVACDYDLTFDAPNLGTHFVGAIQVFLVRGDSAVAVPGFDVPHDASRWFIERCDDLSVPPVDGAAAAAPAGPDGAQARSLTWAEMKRVVVYGNQAPWWW